MEQKNSNINNFLNNIYLKYYNNYKYSNIKYILEYEFA